MAYFLNVAMHASRNFCDLCADGRHDHSGSASLHELYPKPLLERTQLRAQGGLADTAIFSGTAEMTVLLKRQQIFKLSQTRHWSPEL